jgi:arginyl-tRNA synthetase
MREIEQLLAKAVKTAFNEKVEIVLTRPDEKFGDYATNIALQLSKKVNQSPRVVAEKIVSALPKDTAIAHAEIAGPGFINLTLSDTALWQGAKAEPAQLLKDKVVVAEYSDPNPFKILHAGHLYTSVVGDAIANLLEQTGAKVHRVNFGGDVGLHVGKTLWAMLKKLDGEHPDKLKAIPKDEHAAWMADAYITGTNAYEDDPKAKHEIIDLNKKIYQLHTQPDHDSAFAQIYWTTRQWSYDYFNEFYERIGTKFEKYYPESEVSELGLKTVKAHIKKGIFEESQGAVIFNGEAHGLHTRVFINKEGLPTYEAKDVGLIFTKKQDYNFDKSVVITGNEQEQYMAVVLKAIEQFAPELALATEHITHGIVKLAGGVKMSSRKGNILRAIDVLEAAEIANKKVTKNDDHQTALGAVKYAFLKQRTGGDIIYDPEESVSMQGNSGPYLQYAHARAHSILSKVKNKTNSTEVDNLQPSERSLVRKLSEYSEVVAQATAELMPHHICTYLYELSQTFNRFYEKNRVVDDPRESLRLQLVKTYQQTLKNGLEILNITAPEKM